MTKHHALESARRGERVVVIVSLLADVQPLLDDWRLQLADPAGRDLLDGARIYRAAGRERVEFGGLGGGRIDFVPLRSASARIRGRALDLVYIVHGVPVTVELLDEISPALQTRPGGRIVAELRSRTATF